MPEKKATVPPRSRSQDLPVADNAQVRMVLGTVVLEI